MQTRTGDNHGLGPAADGVLHLRGEVLHHDPHLLVDRVRVQLDEGLQQVGGLFAVVAGIVLDDLQQPPVGRVGRVVVQHVEDEPLLDRLPHAVEAEGREAAVLAACAKEFQGPGFGRGGERERRQVRQPAALLHLGQDAALQLLLRRLGPGLLLFGLLQPPGGQYGLQALGALPRLGGVRLVDDDREPLAGQVADLLGDDRKLLQRGDDDRLAGFQGLLELARSGVDVLHHPQGLLELAHRALELAVEHAPVGDDHDRVEDPAVLRVMERRELVGQPSDGVRLARARGVLDQVALPRALLPGVGHEASHRVELMVAGEDQGAGARLAALVVLLLDLVDELPYQIQDAVPRPDALPQVGRRVALLRGRHRRIARPAELALVEGQEARRLVHKLRGDVDQLRVHREVSQASAVGQERLAGIAVAFVLRDGVLDVLSGERIFEFGGEERQTVQEDPEVQAVLVLLAVVELPHHREEVAPVEALEFLVEAAGGPEVGESKLAAGILDAVPQHVQRTPPLDLAG